MLKADRKPIIEGGENLPLAISSAPVNTCTFGDASSDFIILTSGLVVYVVHSVIQCFPGAVIGRADHKQLLLQLRWLLSWKSIDDSRFVPESLTQCCWTSPLCVEQPSLSDSDSELESYLPLDDIEEFYCRLMSLFSRLQWQRFERHLNDFLQGVPLLSESDRLGNDLVRLWYVSTVSIRGFDANMVLYFPASMAVSIIRLMIVAIDYMNRLEVNNLFESPSTTPSVSENFTI